MSENATATTASAVELQTVCDAPELSLTRAHADDAGLDLASAIDYELAPGERALIPTGVRIALPPATVGLVCPRSGLAAKHGITIVNGPGIVDEGYRGELKVALLNTDRSDTLRISRGDRIAQLVIVPILRPRIVDVDSLDEAERGEAGFGSSGGFSSTADSTGNEA
ncbi:MULTISPECIES: dUTP diphosphatase [Dermabacter]|uniref:Deoxyuridine 5'-triphosphate nucleotidohydrolase n=1 Tax=Dermabacter jinjuensis TaxID=1667168 RepID=A0ABM6PMH9_9MICO|nr:MULTISPECIES: dUTP diphosphatase [Dermabacter]ATH96514.1 dUTP diphosphatase [Dermabacter jinjuensis]EPH14467.1 dUTP diphosphatase [Dermabacter sp. HFH0086]UEB90602.1 dUTP diphosphatase [Dermabacter jinjuensis]